MLTLTDTQECYYFYNCVMSAFSTFRQILYANGGGQLWAMLNALFIFVKAMYVCTREGRIDGEGAAGNSAIV